MNKVELQKMAGGHCSGEVEQPVSDFIFRMNQSSGVSCAIFEADGGAWKNAAMNNICKYLKESLPEGEQFIVIS